MIREIKIFTDGASSGNPGPGGWGVVIATQTQVREIGGGEKDTTNNRMELQAVVSALDFLDKNEEDKITIYSDSAYVINGATSWISNWKKNNWQTKQKTDVLNKDLWIQLDSLLKKHNCNWIKLEGHTGIPGNERADVIASSFAQSNNIDLYNGDVDKYDIDLSSINTDKPMKVRKDRSKMKAYSYLSLVDGSFKKHSTWTSCEDAVRGKAGAKFRKSISEEDEQEIMREWGVAT